jgi:hypothetical protein
MKDFGFDIHFGVVKEKKDDFEEVIEFDEPDDDEELEVTPPDVVGMLGFDPKEFSTKKKKFGIGAVIKKS